MPSEYYARVHVGCARGEYLVQSFSMHGDQEEKDPQILVVEDDEDAREAMVSLLQMKGYRAVPAGNGREALDYLDQAAGPRLDNPRFVDAGDGRMAFPIGTNQESAAGTHPGDCGYRAQ